MKLILENWRKYLKEGEELWGNCGMVAIAIAEEARSRGIRNVSYALWSNAEDLDKLRAEWVPKIFHVAVKIGDKYYDSRGEAILRDIENFVKGETHEEFFEDVVPTGEEWVIDTVTKNTNWSACPADFEERAKEILDKAGYMKEEKIEIPYQLYVDLDGVLVDFAEGAKKAINDDLRRHGDNHEGVAPRLRNRYRKMVKALRADRTALVITQDDFDKFSPTRINAVRNYMYPRLEADEGFWENLGWTGDGKRLWEYVNRFSPAPIILTSPMHGQESHEGKKRWVEEELGIKKDSGRLIIEKDKWAHAAPNHILIDDTPTKVGPWIDNEGKGVLHTSTDESIDELRTILGDEPEKEGSE